jgi:hypothetical protein
LYRLYKNFVRSKFQEESNIDLTEDDDGQYDVIDDFADDVLMLCRGRSKSNLFETTANYQVAN